MCKQYKYLIIKYGVLCVLETDIMNETILYMHCLMWTPSQGH